MDGNNGSNNSTKVHTTQSNMKQLDEIHLNGVTYSQVKTVKIKKVLATANPIQDTPQ